MLADRSKKLFVLDTSVLMHDSTALFRFHEHDIFLPMVVLEELDRNKKGPSESALNARQAARFINESIAQNEGAIDAGVLLNPNFSQIINERGEKHPASGRLYFQTESLIPNGEKILAKGINDNAILDVALALKEQYRERVILVSKDINLRIKANILGLTAEDYFNDQVLEDADLLHCGYHEYERDFWDKFDKNLDSWNEEEGRSFYRLRGEEIAKWRPNEGLFIHDDSRDYIVRSIEGDSAVIEALKNYEEKSVWGISARNQGQNFALNLLLDPEIDFVTLLGAAGTGKTLLALAAGLAEVLDHKRYDQIIMTRATVPVGDDIGFLPGTEEEKMAPWMGALMDNLEVLLGAGEESKDQQHRSSDWAKGATNDLLANRVKIKSLNFMRGRTFQNKWLIIDEAQNLTSKQMKTLITRAGLNTKVICLGNIAQIDTPFLTETTSGLTYVVDKFKEWEHSGHITLEQGERSRLAQFASENL